MFSNGMESHQWRKTGQERAKPIDQCCCLFILNAQFVIENSRLVFLLKKIIRHCQTLKL